MKGRAQHQHGVVLIVALIMMAVIAISSSVALKGALSQDIVRQSTLTQCGLSSCGSGAAVLRGQCDGLQHER